MKLKDLQTMSQEELAQKLDTLHNDLFNLNYQRRMGRVEKPHQFFLLKKDIARIRTILRDRQLNEKV